ncbi:GNAT family N-acetyltransferase [bacterium]|nr:GNAT family N-acetyltransferase [bacterium]
MTAIDRMMGITRHPIPLRPTDAAVFMGAPAPRDLWDLVAASDPYALVSQTPEWMDAMVALGDVVNATRWYRAADGRDLILPMARRRFGGRRATRSSFGEGWGFGGLLAPGGPTRVDVTGVFADLATLPALRTTMRVNPLQADVWDLADHPEGLIERKRLAHVIDLAGGSEAVWSDQTTSQGRRGVRRARKLGVEVRRDTDGDLLPVFYDMLLQSFDRWAERQSEPRWLARYRGKRRDPLEKFAMLSERLGDAFGLYVAFHEDRPAAAVLVLMGANAHYTRGVMDVEVGGTTNANDLLHWTAIEDACASGCLTYHMGESSEGSSLARYKQKMGATPVPYAEYIVERMPLTRMDAALRGTVKRMIGFKDA